MRCGISSLPDTWEDELETVHFTNTVGDDVEVEKKAYDAYLQLKEALEAEDIHVDLDSARRSVAAQQEIMNRFIEKYGADYANKTVAQPGYSEHHTGLAKYIMDEGLTLEEARKGSAAPEVSIDYGSSEIFTEDEIKEAVIRIKCDFASWDGCELHSIKYAGDESNSEENIKWLNSLNEGNNYTQVAEFLGDFHSPVTESGAWNPDYEYTDYQWWLGRTEDGSWDIVSTGY